ncbi:MAG: hypothetical protein AAF581_06740 [Planctomycetota bacterium]
MGNRLKDELNDDEAYDLDGLATQIWEDFDQAVPLPRVHEVTRELAERFADATVLNFVPVIIRSRAREQLSRAYSTRWRSESR